MALLSGAGTFHRLAEKKEVTDMGGFESHTLAPLLFMEQPSNLHSGVYQRENLRGSHAHLGLGPSSCFCDPDHINLSFWTGMKKTWLKCIHSSLSISLVFIC